MAKKDAEKEDDKSVNESELVDAFNVFWSKDGDRLPVEEWKNVVTPEAKTVVSFLKSNRSPGPKLMVCQAYKNCKEKWQNSKEKDSATSEEDFQHDENCVNWEAIKSPLGIVWYINIRNWPMWMLSESNKHTRGYVLETIEAHPVKGVAMIMDKAEKMLGEIKKEREEKQQEREEKKAEKEAAKAQEEQDPEANKKGIFYVYAKKVAKKASDKMRDEKNSIENKRQVEKEAGIDSKNIVVEADNKNATELE